MLQGGGAQELIKDRSTKAEEMKQVSLKVQMIILNGKLLFERLNNYLSGKSKSKLSGRNEQ